jgi:hypothetical protein
VLRCFIKIYFQFSSRCAEQGEKVSGFLPDRRRQQNKLWFFTPTAVAEKEKHPFPTSNSIKQYNSGHCLIHNL